MIGSNGVMSTTPETEHTPPTIFPAADERRKAKNKISTFSYLCISQFQQYPSPPPGISWAFFLIVRLGGRALVYPGAFDGLVIFTSQYCHFLSVLSSSDKRGKSVINFV